MGMDREMRKVAKNGALLIMDLYQMIQQWRDQGRPNEGKFEWNRKDILSPLAIISPLIWGKSYGYRRKPGGRIRYEWVAEQAPIAVLAREDPDTVYIAFRGTSLSKEWDMNANFRKIRPWTAEGSRAAVHQGFQSLYVSLQSRLREELSRVLKAMNCQRIVICGHSLGGALAALAAHDLSKNFPDGTNVRERWLITCGAPRVGDNLFAGEVESAVSVCLRIVVEDDPVTSVPPEDLEYVHAGSLVSFDVPSAKGLGKHSMQTYLEVV